MDNYRDISQRGCGFSTLQIRRAPAKAYYIVVGDPHHYRVIAMEHKRGDLTIMSASVLNDISNFKGRMGEIIIDHAVDLTKRQVDNLRSMRKIMRSQWAGI